MSDDKPGTNEGVAEAVSLFIDLAEMLESTPPALTQMGARENQRMYAAVWEEAVTTLIMSVGSAEDHPVATLIRREAGVSLPRALSEKDAPPLRAWAGSVAEKSPGWMELAALSPEYAAEVLG